MSIRLLDPVIRIATVQTRMPFRYGIATLTQAPHLFIEARVESGGKTARGVAADLLPPKWFTKNPATSLTDDIAEMLDVIGHAARAAAALGQCETVFEAWRAVYAAQDAWGAARGVPPLLWNFGVSLVERVMIDGWCRAHGCTFAHAIRENFFGVRLRDVDPQLTGAPRDWLPREPLGEIIVRHTVGLSDPLTEAEIPSAERLDDGLPHSLAACIAQHGLTHFKIKLAGEPQRDAERLRAIAAVVGSRCAYTLDGNENYTAVAPLRDFWERLRHDVALGDFLEGLIAIEQPMHRDVALSETTADELRRWAERPPLIIDESDADLASLPRALGCGYLGTSHKNCKGVIKGVINTCRLRQRVAGGGHAVLTAEDLSNIGPVALLQDLAVVATLGIVHAERNGHHYFAGLSQWPAGIQRETLSAHPDLYEQHAGGFPALRVHRGKIATGSVVAAPFGYGSTLDLTPFPRLEEWERTV